MRKNRSVNNARIPKSGSVKRGSHELSFKDVEFMKKYNIDFMLDGKKIWYKNRDYIRYKYKE